MIEITFDSVVERYIHNDFLKTKDFTFNVYMRVPIEDAFDDAWTSLLLDECPRIDKLNGVEETYLYTTKANECFLKIRYTPTFSVNGNLICPVSDYLFAAIIVAIETAYKNYTTYKNYHVKDTLTKLEKNMRESKP